MHEHRTDLFITKTKKGWKIVKPKKSHIRKPLPAGAENMPCLCQFNEKDQKKIKTIGKGIENNHDGGDCYSSDDETSGEGLGGSLSVTELKGLLGAAYNPQDQVQDFVLDKGISSSTSQVYHNPQTGQTVVSHRGTKGLADWGNNLIYALGGKKGYKMTPRFKEAQKVQRAAQTKYGMENVSTIGHSQGGLQAELLGQKSKEVITFNKATRPFANKKGENQYDIRHSGDIVSSLNPFQGSNQKEIELETTEGNPIGLHKITSIEDSDRIVGKGIKLKSPDTIMLGRTIHPAMVSDRFPRTPQSFAQVHLMRQVPIGSGLYASGGGILDEKFSVNDVVRTGRELFGRGILDEKFSVNDVVRTGRQLFGRGMVVPPKPLPREYFSTHPNLRELMDERMGEEKMLARGFSKKQLNDIILHKNKVIEDLEEEAYTPSKGGKLTKGSPEAKAHMARIRQKRMKGGRIPQPASRSYVTDSAFLG